MDKTKLQETAARRLENSKRLVCQWCTSCGKSGVALQFLKAHPDFRCLIVVPEENNISNWIDEFKKFNVPYERVTVICYASLHKYKDTKWDILVLDEVPHMDTDKKKEILKTISAEYVLALGAVIDKDEMNSLESVYGKFDKSYITISMAIDMGILPIPEIRIIHMRLDRVTRRWHKGRALTDGERYDLIKSKVDKAFNAYSQNSSKFNKNRMLSAGFERKRFLGELKGLYAKEICNALNKQNKRFLCFCSSIKQAEELGGELAFTSHTPTSAKMIERFNNHEINSMYVVGKCIEGQNLADIDCGVITQLGGKDRITVQSIGRIMRSDNPVVYAIVFDDTKDDTFIRTITFNIPKNYIKHYKYNSINQLNNA